MKNSIDVIICVLSVDIKFKFLKRPDGSAKVADGTGKVTEENPKGAKDRSLVQEKSPLEVGCN